MTYVEEILRKDEIILYQASVHWRVYLSGIFFIIFGFSGFSGSRYADLETAAWTIIFGLGWLVVGFIRRRTTELVVTDRRVISKTGWISRKRFEIDRAAVESVTFRQSMLGRLLGYGTVEVLGRGGGIAPMKCIDKPVEFRNQVYQGESSVKGAEQARGENVLTMLGTHPSPVIPATAPIQAGPSASRLEYCPTCGNQTSKNASLCPSCRDVLTMPSCGEEFEPGWADRIAHQREQEAEAARLAEELERIQFTPVHILRRRNSFGIRLG